ncbi:MAG: hypothetical protein ACTHK8_18855 [Ginsengibacter sp.]
MKSTNNESNPFSMEDFEKGLMLAGLISPNTIEELQQRTILENFEKEQKASKSAQYFKRSVLAAKVASELHSEPTFGRVKFQKLVYLCEHVCKLNTQDRYEKFAAGPFDSKFMHSIEKEFEKQKWFKVEKEKKGTIIRSKYVPLSQCEKFKLYYERYFAQDANSINHIIKIFRREKTDFTEVAATLTACYFEIKEKNEVFSEELLLDKFYNWSKEKQRFDEKRVLTIWQWLNEKNIIEFEQS